MHTITEKLKSLKSVDEIINYLINFDDQKIIYGSGRKELKKYFYLLRIVMNFEKGQILECKKYLEEFYKYLEIKKIESEIEILDSSILSILKVQRKFAKFEKFNSQVESELGNYDFLFLKENFHEILNSLDKWLDGLDCAKDRISFIQLLINLELIESDPRIKNAFEMYRRKFPALNEEDFSEGVGTRIFKLPKLEQKNIKIKKEDIQKFDLLYANDRIESKVFSNQLSIVPLHFAWDNSDINQNLIIIAIKEKKFELDILRELIIAFYQMGLLEVLNFLFTEIQRINFEYYVNEILLLEISIRIELNDLVNARDILLTLIENEYLSGELKINMFYELAEIHFLIGDYVEAKELFKRVYLLKGSYRLTKYRLEEIEKKI
ncbi:MAG: hypothetical protein H6622_02515 [Halobacteriovoraceae bacterium]|nr:hypothetical protein [Halobacteriovoraceae bacterium]